MARTNRKPAEPVVLHSGMAWLLNAYIAPVGLIALSIWASVTRQPTFFSIAVGMTGAVFALIALLDMPIHTVFDRRGVTRVCALRRHLIPWSQISAIERAPTRGSIRSMRDPTRVKRPGGLVARIGKRRYLLVNRPEGALEYDALASAIPTWDDVVAFRVGRPSDDTAPTHLYRKKR